MTTVLIVDDEKGIRAGLATAIARVGHKPVVAASLAEARAKLDEGAAFDCALLDIRLKDGDGLDLLREVRAGKHRDLPVIVATAFDDGERTIQAMRDGAFDYVTKPFDLPRLLETLERAIKTRRTAETIAPSASDATPLVGRSAAMHAAWKLIGRAAASHAPVLVKGEAGVGKELVARAIHAYSPRAASGVEVVRADATTPLAELRESLARADTGGTLLVDGAGELPSSVQSWLGAWIAEGPRSRILATVRTARDVAEPPLVPELYYQLAVIEIAVPPLRDRRSDVPLLAARGLAGTRARAVSEEAMAALVRYDWPGNVRELLHVIRRAAELCAGEVLDVHDLPPELAAESAAAPSSNHYLGLPLREAVARLERDLLRLALQRAEGNRTMAAKLLGIPRPQLYAKLEERGLLERRPRQGDGRGGS